MSELRIGYKVFKGKKVLRPATKSALQRIRYNSEDWTVQNEDEHGPFAVFQELAQAQAFLNRGYGNIIRKVEYVPSEGKKNPCSGEKEVFLWKKNPPVFCRNSYGGGYHAEARGESILRLKDCPEGTVLASRIKIIKE